MKKAQILHSLFTRLSLMSSALGAQKKGVIKASLGKKIYKDSMDYRGQSIIWFYDDHVVELKNTDKDWLSITSI